MSPRARNIDPARRRWASSPSCSGPPSRASGSSARWRSSSRAGPGSATASGASEEDAAARGADGRLRADHRVDERPHRLRQGSGRCSRTLRATPVSAPRLRFPHPLILLVLCVLVAAALTWLLPAGRVRAAGGPGGRAGGGGGRDLSLGARRARSARSRRWSPSPRAWPTRPRSSSTCSSSAARSRWWSAPGALGRSWSTGWRSGWPRRGIWVIPIVGFAFAWGGILIQMQEELIAFVPVLLLLVRRLGFNAADRGGDEPRRGRGRRGVQPDQPVPGRHRPEGGRRSSSLSGWEFRSVFLAVAWLVWIAGTMRFARRTRVAPEVAAEAEPERRSAGWRQAVDPGHRARRRSSSSSSA